MSDSPVPHLSKSPRQIPDVIGDDEGAAILRRLARSKKLKNFSSLPKGSLEHLAAALGKSSKQVRRYCKAGFVPGATRTLGGHWRVPFDLRTVCQVREAIHAFAR